MSNRTIVMQLIRDEGFSLIEVGIGLMLACALAGIALIGIQGTLPGINANKAMYQTVAQLRQGRQLAIAQRRSIQLNIGDRNTIQLVRNEFPEGEVAISTVALNNGFEFTQFGEITDDTPDRFGSQSAVDFGGASALTFLSDGTLVDDSGNPVNGTILVGLENHPETARAVTILGATGRIRGYRWTGDEWIQ